MVLITGASSGLEAETAKYLTEKRAAKDKLQNVMNAIVEKGGTAIYKVIDVNDKGEYKSI